jgi:hypothetical protein
VTIHLQKLCVSSSSRAAVEELPDDKFGSIFRLEYNDFVKEFVRHLMIQFQDKVDKFVTTAVQVSLTIHNVKLPNIYSTKIR